MIEKIRKRDGRIVDFNKSKIVEAVRKAIVATGEKDMGLAERVADRVVAMLEAQLRPGEIPSVEQVQDIVEESLMREGYYKVAKAYILYRELHSRIRELVDGYVTRGSWLVRENANSTYSLQALNFHISSQVISEYWLHKIYKTDPEIREAHLSGDFHIHNLGVLGPYCVGWDIAALLRQGFTGVRGKISSKPARHLRTALGHAVNFFYTMQGESAGAQAFSNFDTYLAPFIRFDHLDYRGTKQALQEFIFNMNIPTRVGFQTPFTNVTLDLKIPEFMKDEPVLYGGEYTGETYGDFQEEMDMFNLALADVMLEGDASERVFTFPIPTINITKNFDWGSEVVERVFETAAKYGIPYFTNFVNSDMRPEDVRSMCCHLMLDRRELKKRGGGLFGANPLTGSIGVVTINVARIGYTRKDETKFLEHLDRLMVLAKRALEIKRTWLEKLTEGELYPYSKFYLREIKEGFGEYWKNHFSTIGLIGMNEACLNLFGRAIADEDCTEFALRVLDYMRGRLQDFQEETGNIYNLEATPAEGASYRLAKLDKKRYPGIIVANEEEVKRGGEPYYTNSTQLPVDHTEDLWEVLRHQEPLQTRYTGGTVVHVWLGESNIPVESVIALVQKICKNFRIPYFTLSPTFSVCPSHGYLPGEQWGCPKCEAEGRETRCEVYSRVVGYLRPVDQWNPGKQEEFRKRKKFDRVLGLP